MSEVKLYCGNCLEIMPMLVSESIDMVITDPPYPAEYSYLWEPVARETARVLKTKGNYITLLGHYQLPLVLSVTSKYLRYWWLLWMEQSNINRLIGKGVAVRGKPALWFVKERRRDFREYGYPFDTIRSSSIEDRNAKSVHKWGQSINWFAHYIGELTKPGETVLDPFLGSGSTGIACVRAGRNFIGIENDSAYFAIAEHRIQEVQSQLVMVLNA